MSDSARRYQQQQSREKSGNVERKRKTHNLSSSSSSEDEFEAARRGKNVGIPPPTRERESSGPQQRHHHHQPPLKRTRTEEQFIEPPTTPDFRRRSESNNASNSSYYESSYSNSNAESSFNLSSSTPSTFGSRSQGEGLAPVVARHYNEIEEKGLEAREESKIVTLRKYNNWAKSMNFNDAMDEFRRDQRRYNTLIGLDLCCGKGGDLRKWEKSRMMHHVVFVDIAEVSLTNCRERYEDMKRKHEEQRQRRNGRGLPLFTAEFIVADCTKESLKSKLSDPSMQFDLVSCQFSFHYCFESQPQAKQMLANATDNLVTGGYFIGTLPNADRIVKRRRQSDQGEFGNEVYKVRFECEEPYPMYGARYFFELADAISCPEFLVHFPTLEKLAAICGLRLLYRHPFEEFHEKHEARTDAKNLLNAMGALETYPPLPGEELHFDMEHYIHAEHYIAEIKAREPHRSKDIRVGTISAVEWEAIRLYIAFCFKKVP